jgi:hypothetical protein
MFRSQEMFENALAEKRRPRLPGCPLIPGFRSNIRFMQVCADVPGFS